ncbi:MAG: GNAT family N-acetyltransferase [Anaerolineae bacterium]|jgi:RimJ/RimL family protein N-acetyltransferase
MPEGTQPIRFEKARSSDAKRLAEASKLAFDYDIYYGAPGPGGPPGYDSAAWQSRGMRLGDYYKIVAGDRIIGGIVVFRQGVRAYEVGRIFIEPEFQNQGIGTEAFEFLWESYPLAKRWTLGTPSWNQRTQHFYKKVGFVDVGRYRDGGVLFERSIAAGVG